MTRILGIDPGLRACGWGVIESAHGRLSFVAAGVIEPPAKNKASLAARLAALHREITAIITHHAPAEAAVEETFVNNNPRAALTLGQARGVCLSAPALQGLDVAEYAANKIKKSVTGVGHGDKTQIQAMIKVLLPKAGLQCADAADALAVAICHAHHRDITERIAIA